MITCAISSRYLRHNFYEILVPVTLPYMRGVYLQYPKDIVVCSSLIITHALMDGSMHAPDVKY